MIKKILKTIIIIAAAALAAFAALLLFLTATEYKPADTTPIAVEGTASESPKPGRLLRILTWNIGYGALGSNADFFMDGGKMVMTADRERVLQNLSAIAGLIRDEDPDVAFLQETDQNSRRSHHIDEVEYFKNEFPDMSSSFAVNYSVKFVPYPIPPIGQVHAGIMTLSGFISDEAARIQLPCPFSWPVRLGNLKRCLLVNRVPVEGSDHELVLVNLHLEAYDDGEGKAAQTAMLRELLEKEAAAGNYVVAAGDFNQSFSNMDQTAYAPQENRWQPGIIDVGEFGDNWQFLMDDSVPSCRSLDQVYEGADKESFQYYLIDGFIVSANLSVKSVRGIDAGFENTDHNPVVLEVAIEGPAEERPFGES